MNVSSFELLFKPQSPAAPDGVAAVDRVIQGYFLSITNLEEEDYAFAIELIAPPVPGQPLRSLTGNALVIVDTPGTDNEFGVLNGPFNGKRYIPSTGNFTIPAHGTALVAVLPSTFGSAVDPTPIATPDFEARGYVRLKLPAVRRRGLAGIASLVFEPQSDRPVKVLLTPQNRTTYLTADGAISDQTQASLPTASGAAMAEIKPEPGFPLVIVDDFTTINPDILDRFDDLTLEERGALLPALMAGIDPEQADLTEFNRSLREAGVGLAVERRRIPEPA
jgi:hypothetical protein